MGWRVVDSDVRALTHAMEAGSPEMLNEKQQKMLEQREAALLSQHSFHWPLEFPRVFLGEPPLYGKRQQGGLDAVVGNPPFLGGLKISGELGAHVLRYLKTAFTPTSGTADLCAYFFRLGFGLICLGVSGDGRH